LGSVFVAFLDKDFGSGCNTFCRDLTVWLFGGSESKKSAERRFACAFGYGLNEGVDRGNGKRIVATILLAWELGGGMGHLAPHSSLVQSLLERGHTIHVASRDVGRAGIVFEGMPIHYWPVPLTLDLPRRIFQPTVSMAHILHNVGFANVTDVTMRIAAWRNLFSAINPDVLLADYSPTALLAARGSGIRTISIGLGFCLPPNRFPIPAFATLAHLATEEQLADDEQKIMATINAALRQHGLPLINHLAGLFHETDIQLLTTIPELDHYPDRGPALYCGLPDERPRKQVLPPMGTGRRIFAYLKPFPAIEALLGLLNQLAFPAIVACDGLPENLRRKHSSPTLSFMDADVDLALMSQNCFLAVTNANPTTSARFLLAGKPVLMIPRQLEQELFAHAVTQRRLGLTVRPNEAANLFPQLAELLNNQAYHEAARSLASRYSSGPPIQSSKVIELVEAG
jgi:UDP:flavonoid glycosyltransferase YjiC (YdhE family)